MESTSFTKNPQVTLNFEMNLGRYINQLTYWHALMWISSARSITGVALNCQHCTLIHPLMTDNSLPMTQVLSSCNKHLKQGKIKPTVQQWQDITMMQFSLARTALMGTHIDMLFMGGKAMYVLWMTNKSAQPNHFRFRFWGHKGSDENKMKNWVPYSNSRWYSSAGVSQCKRVVGLQIWRNVWWDATQPGHRMAHFVLTIYVHVWYY